MTTHRIIALPAILALLVTVSAVPAADAVEPDVVAIDRGMLLYELNRARWSPTEFAARAGDVVFPAGLLPAPPLAPNPALMASATAKADEMATHEYFGHQSEVTGMWPNELARTSGYDLPAQFRDDANGIESIYAGSSRVIRALSAFARSSSHRTHLFGVGASAAHTEFGGGRSTTENYWAVHTAYSDPAARFVTGAVFEDLDLDGAMSWGEGLEGVTVAVGMVEVTTDAAGLYSVPAAPGTHEVRFDSGGPLATSVIVDVGDHNVWVDLPVGEDTIVRSYALCAGERPTILGTSGDDVLVATDGRDVIAGLGGDDVVVGADSQDVVCVEGYEPSAPTEPEQSVQRLGGIDRYATAAQVSKATHSGRSEVVFLATGQNFPDALAAGPAAARLGAPILLVTVDEVPRSTLRELSRLSPSRVVILGGTAAIGRQVEEAVGALLPHSTVERVAGRSRIETAVALSRKSFEPGVDTVFVASGRGFADALVASPAAFAAGGPLLLIEGEGVPGIVAAELDRLDPARIVVVGSTGSVSAALAAELRHWAPVTRVAGDSRYTTATAVSAAVFQDGAPVVYVAVGTDFPDALAGGAAVGNELGPVLLVGRDGVSSDVLDEIARLAPHRIIVLGGPNAVSDDVVRRISVSPSDPRG